MQEITTQLKNLLEGRQNVLITSHKKIDGDGLSAMLVLKKFLEKEGKMVTAYSAAEVNEIYHFLPYMNEVELNLRKSNDFIISLQSSSAEVDKMRYSVDGNTLNIIVTPKSGTFTQHDVTAKQAVGKYDLIIVVDSGDLEHLGRFYEDNIDLFYSTPIVNIDHHVTNTGFGQLNIVDITSASSTEIVYRLLKEWYQDDVSQFINDDIATLILTGLITDTGSFQHSNTSPKSLELAADLIEKGARQQEIIQNIYKTKQLSTLKLWGRILAKIEEDTVRKLVWSTVSKEDLQTTGATLEDADGLIDELMTNAPGAELAVLIKDSFEGEMSVSLRSTSITLDTLKIAQHFGGGGHKMASGFTQKGYNFNVFVADVIDYINKFQQERLGLSAEEIYELERQMQEMKRAIKVKPLAGEISLGAAQKRDILSEMIESDNNYTHSTDEVFDSDSNMYQASTDMESMDTNENINEAINQEEINETPIEEELSPMQVAEVVPEAAPTTAEVINSDVSELEEMKSTDATAMEESVNPIENQAISENTPVTAEPIINNIQAEPVAQEEVPQVIPVAADTPTESIPALQDTAVPQDNTTPQETPAYTQDNTQAQTTQTDTSGQLSKAQATQYAQYYAQQLHTMNPQTPEYAQIYQYYQYYAQLAQTLVQ